MQTQPSETVTHSSRVTRNGLLSFMFHHPAFELVSWERRISNRQAVIHILWSRDIRAWPSNPPVVWCDAKWVRRDIDWHAYSDGRLCWCLAREWRDVQGWCGKTEPVIQADGLRWLLGSTDLLLNRHHYGYKHKLKRWKPCWSAWSHGSDGVLTYERERRERYGR